MKVERFNVYGQDLEVVDRKSRDTIGNEVLKTNAQTLKGAINEVNALAKVGVSITEDVVNKALVIVTGGVK